MVAAALDVDRAKIRHAREAVRQWRPVQADAGVGDARPRHLEQDAPQLVVDHLLVLVLRLAAEALEHRRQADADQQVGIAEGEVERDDEHGLAVFLLDLDAHRLEGGELRGRERARRRARLELAVDHAVRAVADDGELVPERRVDVRVVAAIVGQPDAERRQELRVGDELLLGAHDAAGDLEPLLVGQPARQLVDDPVVLAREQRVGCGERNVLVRAHVTGDDRPSSGVPSRRPISCISGAELARPRLERRGNSPSGNSSRAPLFDSLPSNGPSRSHSSRWLVPP